MLDASQPSLANPEPQAQRASQPRVPWISRNPLRSGRQNPAATYSPETERQFQHVTAEAA